MKTNKELNLLSCPHCGKPATLWAVDMSEGVYVFCDNCGMRGPVTEEMTEHAAIAAWNALPRRADIERVERERDWLAGILAEHCNKQDPSVYEADGSYCHMCKAKCQHPFTECENVTPEMWLEKAK